MVHKLAILSSLIVSATCMVLHQAPLPLYLPLAYQEQTPSYNFAYEVNDPHTGDFKRHEESRRGGTVLGHYSLLQPDGITRTVDYRADDLTGFNAVVNNERSANNGAPDREVDNGNGRAESERQNNGESQENLPQAVPNNQHIGSAPVVISHASVVHQSYSNGHNSWI